LKQKTAQTTYRAAKRYAPADANSTGNTVQPSSKCARSCGGDGFVAVFGHTLAIGFDFQRAISY